MSLKSVYLVQAGEKSIVNNNIAYLPYAAGTIAAKAWNNITVRNAFNLGQIVFLRESVKRVADSMKNPFLVGFSCYIWNTEYSKAVAKIIKKEYPECLIVFGGHNVPPDTSLLDENDTIDILVHGEGEVVFEKLLCSLATGGNLSGVPNISFRENDGALVQTRLEAITGCDYPSPYTGGFFDRIINENPNLQFHGTLETNRGCVNDCAFCDWGPHKTSIRMFPMERIRDDIEWLSKNKIEYVWGTDANFGQFERDSQIAEWLIEAKNKYGFPKSFRANYAKFNNRNVFNLAKKFSQHDLSKSTTVSLQTLSDDVLNNIGRSNMPLEHFSEIITLYRSAGIPTYTELILALPGETYESFTTGIGRLLDSGQHAVIEVYDCVLLPNSTLATKDFISEHRIETVCVPFFQYHCEAGDGEVVEYTDIVISTKTMSCEDWIRCKLFSTAVQSMHCLGLLRCASIYLHYEKHIGYKEIYTDLVQWYLSHPNTLGFDIFTKAFKLLQEMISEKKVPYYYDKQFGDVRWPLDEGAFLCFISDIDRFYSEAGIFLSAFGIEPLILNQLLEYQKKIICVPGNQGLKISQDYDFYGYMLQSLNNDPKPLKKIKNTVSVSSGGGYANLADYAREVVWYGRRLGKTIYTSNPECVEVCYCSD